MEFDEILSICGHFGESGESNEILPRLLTQLYERIGKGTLKSRRIWRKWRIWWNFAKVVHRIMRVNRCDLARGAPKSRRIWPAKVTILISGHKWQNGLLYRQCYLFTHSISNFAYCYGLNFLRQWRYCYPSLGIFLSVRCRKTTVGSYQIQSAHSWWWHFCSQRGWVSACWYVKSYFTSRVLVSVQTLLTEFSFFFRR